MWLGIFNKNKIGIVPLSFQFNIICNLHLNNKLHSCKVESTYINVSICVHPHLSIYSTTFIHIHPLSCTFIQMTSMHMFVFIHIYLGIQHCSFIHIKFMCPMYLMRFIHHPITYSTMSPIPINLKWHFGKQKVCDFVIKMWLWLVSWFLDEETISLGDSLPHCQFPSSYSTRFNGAKLLYVESIYFCEVTHFFNWPLVVDFKKLSNHSSQFVGLAY
jgi:hypothetical protein